MSSWTCAPLAVHAAHVSYILRRAGNVVANDDVGNVLMLILETGDRHIVHTAALLLSGPIWRTGLNDRPRGC
jgi:hypothetical protein